MFHMLVFVVADDLKSDDVLEGRLNGDKDTLDELEESRREDKNGFKAKFMFNIADGGFTGKNKHNFDLISNRPALIKEVIEMWLQITCILVKSEFPKCKNDENNFLHKNQTVSTCNQYVNVHKFE